MKHLILSVLKEMTGAPSEFQLLPWGKIDISGDEPAYLYDQEAAALIEEFKKRGNDMVIDYEHQTMQDVQAPAAGWIKRLVWKGTEGLWAAAILGRMKSASMGPRLFRRGNVQTNDASESCWRWLQWGHVFSDVEM